MRHLARTRGADWGRARAGAWIPLADIAPTLVAATVTAEDPRFFEHRGVDWHSVAYKVSRIARTGRVTAGASTITQQLSRNLYLTPTRSIVRKLRELWIARRVERVVSKPRILELYLNVIEWGQGIWGCSAASAHYFGKVPRDLDLFEATFLVSLIPAPRMPLTGINALRSRGVQLLLTYELLLAGLVDGPACAACGQRVGILYRRLSEGQALGAALASASSAAIDIGTDGELLNDLAASLDVKAVPPDQALANRLGLDQGRMAFRRLRGRFGDDTLREVMNTGSYMPLRRQFQVDVSARQPEAPAH